MAVRQLKQYVSWVQYVVRQLRDLLSINLAICGDLLGLEIQDNPQVTEERNANG